MARKIFGFGSLVLAIFAFAAMASAEDAKIGSMTLDELKKALGMSIYLQGGYTYNGNAGTVAASGDTEQNDLRVFDHKANSFVLDIAQIVFAKDPAPGKTGYKPKVSARGPIPSTLPRHTSAITQRSARDCGSISERWSPTTAQRSSKQ